MADWLLAKQHMRVRFSHPAPTNMIEPTFTINDLYKETDNFTVSLEYYYKGKLFSNLTAPHPIGTITYEFPVPVAEAGEAIMPKTDKVTLFRRYIEAAIKNEELKVLSIKQLFFPL